LLLFLGGYIDIRGVPPPPPDSSSSITSSRFHAFFYSGNQVANLVKLVYSSGKGANGLGGIREGVRGVGEKGGDGRNGGEGRGEDLNPWLFEKVPQRFWADKANQRRYIDWLGRRLGYTSPQDWYV